MKPDNMKTINHLTPFPHDPFSGAKSADASPCGAGSSVFCVFGEKS